ncbi:MAG: sugar phosphate isomerase/epimerase [Verrucomicrobia bacterium]|nr:sugar phosphate isomerase/epimerase [Verrucomicrobiota bacterium]
MNRRSFIQTASRAAAATAAVGALPLGTFAQQPRTRMTINLVCGAIGVEARTQADVNALAVKHGFQSVEALGGDLAGMSPTQLGDLLGSMKQNRIVFGACGLSVDFRGTEEGFQESLRKFKSVAAGLERAGVDRVNTWLSPSSRDLTYIRNFRQHADRLRQVAQVLKDHGQRLGLEYVGTHTLLVRGKYPFIHTLGETRDLIAEIGTGNVGLVLDSWHWWQAGDSGEDIQSLTNHDIIAADLNDAPKGRKKNEQIDSQRELPMATGEIDVATFLNAMNRVGYDGPVRAEPFNAPLRAMDNDAACAASSQAMKKAFALIT